MDAMPHRRRRRDVTQTLREPWTAEELVRLPDGWRYEIDDGELVILPPAGLDHGEVSLGVGAALRAFVRSRALGTVAGAETGFRLRRRPDLLLAPDVAYISAERRSRVADPSSFAEVAPDLVVEVLSPSDTHAAVLRKVAHYLEAGVRSVWVVDAGAIRLTRYAADRQAETFADGAALVTDPVLPGFACPLADLIGR